MKVLVACEESQAVCLAFRERGHEAYSCDLQPCSGGHPEWHFQDDVFAILKHIKPDLMVGHPPCTFLSNAGIGYFNTERYGMKAYDRMQYRLEASAFFVKLLSQPIEKICLENPVGFINGWLKPTQIINPYYFGDADKKKTCLWLKNLPQLKHRKAPDLFGDKTHVEVKPTYIDESGKPRYFTDAISGG